MSHPDPFAPADSAQHPANFESATVEPESDSDARYWHLAKKYLTPAEAAAEDSNAVHSVAREVLEEREAAVLDYVRALVAIGSKEGDDFPDVMRPEIVDTTGEVWQWEQPESEGESGWFMPSSEPVAPEPEPAPPVEQEPAKRGRKKTPGGPDSDALAAALAKLDNTDSA
jgi:hypothetical protein